MGINSILLQVNYNWKLKTVFIRETQRLSAPQYLQPLHDSSPKLWFRFPETRAPPSAAHLLLWASSFALQFQLHRVFAGNSQGFHGLFLFSERAILDICQNPGNCEHTAICSSNIRSQYITSHDLCLLKLCSPSICCDLQSKTNKKQVLVAINAEHAMRVVCSIWFQLWKTRETPNRNTHPI